MTSNDKPPTIELFRGQPNETLLGRAHVESASAAVFRRGVGTVDMLNYGPDRGPDSFLASLADFLNEETQCIASRECRRVETKHLFASAGNSHALGQLCTLLLRREHGGEGGGVGDVQPIVLCERATYPFALMVIRDHNARVVGCDGDYDDVVAQMRRLCDEHGKAVKMVYVVPSFHNPTGLSMSAESRKELVALAHERDFFVICDDVYQLLGFTADATPPPPIIAYEDDAPEGACRVISLGTFSKLLAPAMRTGWIHTRNVELLDKLQNSGEVWSGGGYSSFAVRIMEETIRAGHLAAQLKDVRRILHERCTAMCNALQEHTDILQFKRPVGGYFVWIEIKAAVTALQALHHCKQDPETPVSFFCGPKFTADGKGFEQYVRFSFAFYECETLVKAVNAFARVVRTLTHAIKN